MSITLLTRRNALRFAAVCSVFAATFTVGRYIDRSGMAMSFDRHLFPKIYSTAHSLSSYVATLAWTPPTIPSNLQSSTNHDELRGPFTSLPLWLTQSSNFSVTPTVVVTREQNPDARPRLIAAAFRPLMTTDERAILLRCLAVLDEALRSANVTYFLYSGSLIGAYRHRGFVPWDDDADVLANYTQLSEIERALHSVAGYELYHLSKKRYKFYSRNSALISGRTWRWPFVDVDFFEENATHLYHNFENVRPEYIFPKAEVFPLAYRPFDGLLLPTPAFEDRVLARNYDVRTCETNRWSHRNAVRVPKSNVTSVPCSELYPIYPFIFRNGTPPPVHEVLRIGDSIIAEFVIS